MKRKPEITALYKDKKLGKLGAFFLRPKINQWQEWLDLEHQNLAPGKYAIVDWHDKDLIHLEPWQPAHGEAPAIVVSEQENE